GEIELVGGLVGLERALVVSERGVHAAEQLVEIVLLAPVTALALLDEHLRERLRFAEALGLHVLLEQRQRGFLAILVALDRKLVRLDAEVVLAEHVATQPTELDEQFRSSPR